MTHALVALFLARFLASGAVAHPQATEALGRTIVCATLNKGDMRRNGWRNSVGAGCANLNTGEVLGGVLTLTGNVRCTFTGYLDVATACAILDGCGGLSRVCL